MPIPVAVEPSPTTFDLTSSVFTLSFSICNLTRLFSTLAVTTPTTLLLNPDFESTYVSEIVVYVPS